MKEIRYLEKMIDDLEKGRPVSKIRDTDITNSNLTIQSNRSGLTKQDGRQQ